MGKTFATKKKILRLLKVKDMTASELANALNLSTATIIQHMEELSRMGAVEKLENEHFRKLKYYHISGNPESHMFRYAFAVLVLAALLSVSYLYLSSRGGSPPGINIGMRIVPKSNLNGSSNQSAQAPNGMVQNATSGEAQGMPSTVSPPVVLNSGGYTACPMLSFNSNGSITGYSGFSLHYINSSSGEIPDYLINKESVGTINISERFTEVLSNQQNYNRTHFYVLTLPSGQIAEATDQINITFFPSSYSAVQNSAVSFKAYIKTMNATGSTFWLRIDGPCGGGTMPVLITIGSRPYNGTVSETAVPYA